MAVGVVNTQNYWKDLLSFTNVHQRYSFGFGSFEKMKFVSIFQKPLIKKCNLRYNKTKYFKKIATSFNFSLNMYNNYIRLSVFNCQVNILKIKCYEN